MIRKPLILNSGNLEQLQAGDRLAPVPNSIQIINGEDYTISAGQPIVIDDQNEAKYANAVINKDVVAFCVEDVLTTISGTFQIDGILSLTTAQWDLITGEVGGLRPGKIYFLDDNDTGRIVRTPPTTPEHYVVRLGAAISTTDFAIMLGTPIKL